MRSTIERVETGNSRLKAAHTSNLPDSWSTSLTIHTGAWLEMAHRSWAINTMSTMENSSIWPHALWADVAHSR
jgi:hypothetical protein